MDVERTDSLIALATSDIGARLAEAGAKALQLILQGMRVVAAAEPPGRSG